MTDANSPAHPTIESINHGDAVLEIKTNLEGVSKREYFAAMAMTGLCALQNKGSFNSDLEAWAALAEHSVLIADSLIEALNKQP